MNSVRFLTGGISKVWVEQQTPIIPFVRSNPHHDPMRTEMRAITACGLALSRKRWFEPFRRFILLLAVTSTAGCTTPVEYLRNGCKVGPNYAPPPAPVACNWIDADDKRVN